MPKRGKNSKCGIYKITFPNGQYYYGQAVDLNRRKRNHLLELRKNKHANKRLQNCWDKYGELVFEIVEECEYERLNEVETKYLVSHMSNPECCNICTEGRSRKGIKASQETKKLISDYQRLNGKVKPVYMFSLDMCMLAKYDAMKDAELAIRAGPKEIGASCRTSGKISVRGYRFMYAQPIDNLLGYIKNLVPIN